MFSNDTKQIEEFLFFALNIVVAPVQIAVCLALIYQQVQEATFVGLGYMFFLFPLNAIVFGYMYMLRQQKVAFTDARVKMMNEVLAGIRIIKYYAWERPFQMKLVDIRKDEMRIVTKLAYAVELGISLVLLAAPVVQPVLIFFTYVKLGNQLDAAKAFTTLGLFNLIGFPFAFLPLGLAQFAQASVSADRILKFLDAEELQDYVDTSPTVVAVSLSMEEVCLSWTKDELSISRTLEALYVKSDVESKEQLLRAPSNRSLYTLKDISFAVPSGSLTAIVGPVGCGKSSLLNGCLGELILTKGKVRRVGTVAYCDQRPWILNASIQENILFGLPYDEARLEQTLYACNLHDDLAVLPGGLLTEIGERGINLSGGQKARVALARAVYRNADIYLLDDPLSAVDAHVGQWLFHECLTKQLQGKTRLLVTHQVHLLSQCDQVIVIVDGEIRGMGTFDELSNRTDLDIAGMLGVTVGTEESENSNETRLPEHEIGTPLDSASLADALQRSDGKVAARVAPQVENAGPKVDTFKIIEDEEKNEGSVAYSTYTFYIKAGGFVFFWLSIFFSAISQSFTLLGAFWLSHWGDVASYASQTNRPLSGDSNITYLNTYALLIMVGIAFLIARSLSLVQLRLGCSLKLHDELLQRILAAPVSFFDVTPTGRILNRFSSDILTVDEELSETINQMVNSLMQCIGALSAIAGATSGTFLIFLIPIVFIYGRMQSYFRKSNTAIARLENVSRSPIYADFSQALNGVSTIRAYGDEKRFIDQLEFQLDRNSIAAVLRQIGSFWLGIRLEFFGASISFFIVLLAVSTAPNSFVSAGYLALGVTYSFQLTEYLEYTVRMVSQFEAQMNAVERVKYYIDNVTQEEPEPNRNVTPPTSWPSEGAIEGKDVTMRYRDGPLVLKGITFSINGCEKVGIAGRTGSGKSTLITALFRIQELAGGTLLIDGVDCGTVPLHVLRSKLGIIPQDPVMFSASVRFNLDPFSEHTDLEIWDVLRNVDMETFVSSLPKKLDDLVAEGGDNFSAGQRQLICIARALLRKPRILILDEATASVDNDTDALIQSMVRQRFKDSTVLTIAHRLHTIIDYDKIMVLDSGYLEEMDTPENLLNAEHGKFRSLWDRHQSSHGLSRATSSPLLGKMTSAMVFDQASKSAPLLGTSEDPRNIREV